MTDTTDYLREHPLGNTEFLVGKAKGGSQAAWNEIHRRYHKMLVAQVQAQIPGFARRRFDAEDVLQNAMAKVVADIQAFEYRGEGSFRCWLATLVVHTFLNELKKQKAEREKLHETAAPQGHDLDAGVRANEIDERRAAMLEVMGQLTDRDRDILIQRHIEELSFESIAEILGCPREQARKLYSLALDKLQRRMRA